VVRNHSRPSRKCLHIDGLCRCIVRRIGAGLRPLRSFVGLNSCRLNFAWMLAKVRVGRSLGSRKVAERLCANGLLCSRTSESSTSSVSLAARGAPAFRAEQGRSHGTGNAPRRGRAEPVGVPPRDVSRLNVRRPESNFYRTRTPRLPGALERTHVRPRFSWMRVVGVDPAASAAPTCGGILMCAATRGSTLAGNPKRLANAMSPDFKKPRRR
jgi:hypothetical protein